ncbi:hypothetical protein K466DRAFT_604697 [Polyporus arcularius HHB13444]|uniref:Uncharacterized protein n=1 Tax=Polyporus arcularius HHB13444 TaxID=1314778 RepID=A0A5C3NXC8_9APHY|nr:hypothetical protein K466DRAFT_604697 [Polyporus arcularius HHB13444]
MSVHEPPEPVLYTGPPSPRSPTPLTHSYTVAFFEQVHAFFYDMAEVFASQIEAKPRLSIEVFERIIEAVYDED